MTSFRMGGALAVVAILGASACDRNTSFGPDIDAFGTFTATAWYEYDGSAGFDGADEAAAGLTLQLLLPGSQTVLAEGTADGEGVVLVEGVPVGRYDLRVDPGFLADSLLVSRLDSASVFIGPNDELDFTVSVTPNTASFAEVMALPAGRRVWFRGMALNTRSSSIEGSVHVLEEGAGALRARFNASTGGAPGDSVRVLGRISGTGPYRILSDARLRVLAQGVRPVVPLPVTVSEARTAGDGSIASRLVVLRSGTVTQVVDDLLEGQRLTVTEGASEVEVFLPLQNGFGQAVQVGSTVQSVVGLLVPDGSVVGLWRLVPRNTGDLRLQPPPPPAD